ncbi:MAG: heavy metal translocating P-type ATPase [Clostridium sp.]
MKLKLYLQGLNCANCANKIENKINKLDEVKEANLNFSTLALFLELNEEVDKLEYAKKIQALIDSIEDGVTVQLSKPNNGGNKTKCTDGSCTISSDNHQHEHGNNDHKHSGHSHGNTHEGHNHSKTSDKSYSNNKYVSLIKDNMLLITGMILFVVGLVIKDNEVISTVIFLLAYIVSGGKVILSALKNIAKGQIFDENSLMLIATVGAFAIGEHAEGVAVMLFYGVGEMLQDYAVNNSRKSISSLMDIRADHANVIRDNNEVSVSPEDVLVDEMILIKPGERVPLDGVIIEGESYLDTSALTGESVPRLVKVDGGIYSGAINISSPIKVKVTKLSSESTVSRILELVENASANKGQTEKFITKFAKVYTPIVVALAVLLAVVPPIVLGNGDFTTWIYRALLFLVVSCPCALVVSIPLGLFAGIGGASKKGILIKGGNYIEALNKIDTIVFDKTGTITKGVFKVSEIKAIGVTKEELLKIAAHGESFSNHPIAKSIMNGYGNKVDKTVLKDYKELGGQGISVIYNESNLLLGNKRLMDSNNIEAPEVDSIGTIIYVALNNNLLGYIIISDEIKEEAKEAMLELKKQGIKQVIILTGDNQQIGDKVGSIVGATKVYGNLMPQDKVTRLEEIIESSQGKVAFVGDGINDAPVLARADIGIAMGDMGSDAAIEAADVVLMRDDLLSISQSIKIANKTNKILWQNIIFSILVKVIVMILGSFGFVEIWTAVFADVGVTIIAVLNSYRCMK